MARLLTRACPGAERCVRRGLAGRLALYPAGGEAADQEALGNQEDDGDRYAGKHGGCSEVAPELTLVLNVLLGADGQGHFIEVADDHRGEREFVHEADERQNEHHRQYRHAQWQQDFVEGLERGGTVYRGGFLHGRVDGVEIANHHEDVQRQAAHVTDDQRGMGVQRQEIDEAAQLVEQQVERDQEQGVGEHLYHQQGFEHGPLALERQPAEGVGAGGRKQQYQHGADARYLNGVHQPAQHREGRFGNVGVAVLHRGAGGVSRSLGDGELAAGLAVGGDEDDLVTVAAGLVGLVEHQMHGLGARYHAPYAV